MSFRCLLSACLGAFLLFALAGCDEKKGSFAHKGATAPDPGALYVDGDQPVELEKYRGRPLILLFFANSCCSEELDSFELLFSSQEKPPWNIIAINVGDTPEEVAMIAEKKKISFPMAYDPIFTSKHRYRLMAVPTVFVVGQDGVVLGRIIGKIPFEQVSKQIVDMLEKTDSKG
ncbi:MAG: hypothetical protein CSB23_03390 [Deltaproteobacteria bacterium]|nr:MAG: hypothetical protein CSB23_03390 [Deltaproteobacteria bacterium]